MRALSFQLLTFLLMRFPYLGTSHPFNEELSEQQIPRSPLARGFALWSTSCASGNTRCGDASCCPSTMICHGSASADSKPARCCSSNLDCYPSLKTSPICADTSWSLYNTSRQDSISYVCCEPGKIGIVSFETKPGSCEPEGGNIPASARARLVSLAVKTASSSTTIASVTTSSTIASVTTLSTPTARTVPTKSPPSRTSDLHTTTPAPHPPHPHTDQGFTVAAIAGILSGTVFLLVGVFVLGLLLHRHKKKRYQAWLDETTASKVGSKSASLKSVVGDQDVESRAQTKGGERSEKRVRFQGVEGR
ncbi:hypothetical protein BCR34DRAFT_582290 [Clohesyomyces aquaticus]|uniref:Mid2 domain-containing protein n=1 Tax=Clohesyomyces aquaticus TaxID=1231657 RepID=A0A1Y2ABC8_9PLEO|nr:hypothetical protein BCR34DRAFT_582290 [Clohesyomyces aquaticus]